MRLTVRYISSAFALLLGFASVAYAQSGWYVGVGIGANDSGELLHSGWNLDPTCYPSMSNCPEQHEGFRWYYDVPTDMGPVLSASVGYRWQTLRVAVGIMYAARELGHRFAGINFLNDTPVAFSGSSYGSIVHHDIGDMSARSLTLSLDYRLLSIGDKLSLYAGAGVGYSLISVTQIMFVDVYSCGVALRCDPKPSSFNNVQVADLADAVLSGHLFAGIDYDLAPRTVLSLEASYNTFASSKGKGEYLIHGVSNLTNETTISKVHNINLVVKLRYMLDFDYGR